MGKSFLAVTKTVLTSPKLREESLNMTEYCMDVDA